MTDITKNNEKTIDPLWGDNAPRGGKTVLRRVLKESATVPLFLGQTFIQSLRDIGYDSTTSALCEHVDNSLQGGASEIRIYFNQSGKLGNYEIDTLVYDNGKGMDPQTLQVSMSFGGSMHYDNRSGIGRFGVGMKTAALSMSPVLDVYSWVEKKAFYKMSIDVDEIGLSTSNLLELPSPEFSSQLPKKIEGVLTTNMNYPKGTQELLVNATNDLKDVLGNCGTLVYMPNCDRLSYKTAKTLVDDATAIMSRVYRIHIAKGVKIYVNNRLLVANDPTYWDKNARHALISEISELGQYQSQLINTWNDIQVPISEGSKDESLVKVKLYKLPIESWDTLPKNILNKKLRIFDRNLVSVMRNDREVYCGSLSGIIGTYHADKAWVRIQVEFDGELDEAFGVAMNKQGIRPKKYVTEKIRLAIHSDLSRISNDVKRYRDLKRKPKPEKGQLTAAEQRASNADKFQLKPLPLPKANSEEERVALDANIRGLAVSLKREGETDEQAYQRVNRSTYITNYKHDEYWPFYSVENQYGKLILTINTAHPFFTSIYSPVSELVSQCSSQAEGDNGPLLDITDKQKEVVSSLEMMLLSLGRTQSVLLASDSDNRKSELYKELRVEWSKTLETQLLTE